MKKNRLYVMGVLVAALLAGCASIKPPFELSNQYFLEKTVDAFDLANIVSGVIPAGSKVAFCSLETENASPFPVAALFEDQMIQSLAKSYRVLERDPQGLGRIILENTAGSGEAGVQREKYLAAGLTTADYIVAYRLQECGIYYEKHALSSEVIRKSFIRIHVRVYNAKTSAVLMAENRISQRSDKIPKKLVPVLKTLDYSDFTPYSYPVLKRSK